MLEASRITKKLALDYIVFEEASILIVDDVDLNRLLLKKYLQSYHFTILFSSILS